MITKGLGRFLRVSKKKGCWFESSSFDIRNKFRQLKLEKWLVFFGGAIMLFSEKLWDRSKIKI